MDFFNKNFALIEESCKLIVEKLHGEQRGIQAKSARHQEKDKEQEIAEEPQNQLEKQRKKKKKPRKNLKNEEDEFLDNLVK